MVAPPRRPTIDVEDLGAILRDQIIDRQPPELYGLASHVEVDEVSDVEVSGIEVTKEGIELAGRALVEIILHYDRGEEKDGVSSYDSYPLSFSIGLDHDLNVARVRDLKVDTSVFDE